MFLVTYAVSFCYFETLKRFIMCGNHFEHLELESQVIVIELVLDSHIEQKYQSVHPSSLYSQVKYVHVTTEKWPLVLHYRQNYWCIQIVVLHERWSLSLGGLWDRFYCM